MVARRNDLWIHTIESFIKDYNRVADLSLDPISSISVVENSVLDSPSIVLGTVDGRIVVVDKIRKAVHSSTAAFASPVEKIFRFPSSGTESTKSLILAVSMSDTVAVVDISQGQLTKIIPGSNLNFRSIAISKTNHSKLCLEYDTATRVWDLELNNEIQEEFTSTEKLYFKSLVANQASEDRSPLLPLASNLKRSSPLVLIDLERLVGLNPQNNRMEIGSAILSCLCPDEGASTNGPFRLSLAVREDELTSITTFISTPEQLLKGEIGAPFLVACVALESIINENADVKKLADLYISRFDIDVISLVRSVLIFRGHFESISQICLARMCRRIVKEEQSAIQLARTWQNQLSNVAKVDIYSEPRRQALLLLGTLCTEAHLLKSRALNFLEKDITESIQLCLASGASEGIRETSIGLLGKGWLVWQKWFNPIQILDSIIFILYSNGFTSKDNPRMTRVVSKCERCIRDISDWNATLLISTLALLAGDAYNSTDGRITSLRLLSLLVTENKGHQPVDRHYLPTLISATVKLLDPTDSALREPSPIGGASLMAEATRFLAAIVANFPESTSFHKGQQKLAVTISREHEGENRDSQMAALIYDLRTGGVSSTLGFKRHYDRIRGLEFSPNGKYVAAVFVEKKGKDGATYSVAVWRLGYGLMSIFQSLSLTASRDTSPSASIPGTPTEESTMQSGALISPKVVREIPIHCKDSLDFQWKEDKAIEITGDLDPRATTVYFE